jgi:MFS family permease
VSAFGSSVTTLALQILAAVTLHATATQVGLVAAAHWLPYLLLGLFAGVVADRVRRRPMLVGTDLGRAVLLGAIPLLYAAGQLTFTALLAIVAAIGALSLFFDAADQAFVPRLVPSGLLTVAYARLEQSGAVAQTAGPVAAGALIRAVGVPAAVAADAVSYLVSGLLLASIRITEQPPPRAGRAGVLAELREGTAWVYRHRMLAPMAASGHIWFLFHGVLGTAFFVFALRGAGLSTLQVGLTYTCAGLGAVLGGAAASACGRRFGVGRTMVFTRALMPVAWLLAPLATSGATAVALLGGTQFLFWALNGIEGPNELAYRQLVTPERLQGRMNTTIRSVNRGALVAGAPLGGIAADAWGYVPALWIGIAGLALAAVALAVSPFRHAVHGDAIS